MKDRYNLDIEKLYSDVLNYAESMGLKDEFVNIYPCFELSFFSSAIEEYKDDTTLYKAFPTLQEFLYDGIEQSIYHYGIE